MATSDSNSLSKVNTMILSKEATEKDRQMKMKLFMSIDNSDSSPSETIWVSNGFFGDQRSDLTVSEENFPENTLLYANQGMITNLKAGEHAIYLDYVVLAQIVSASVCPPNIDNYEFGENEMLLLVPLYNTKNGYFKGLKKWLGYIIIRGNPDEQFYSYGFDEEKSKVLCTSMKQPVPNIFQGTALKKHVPFLIDAKGSESSSKMFFFLSSTTNKKKKLIDRLTMLICIQLIVCTMILKITHLRI